MTAGRKALVAALAVAVVSVVGVFALRSRATRPAASSVALSSAPLPGGVRPAPRAPVPGPRFAGANVVVITIDTLRRDHLAPYGARFETPAATRLAREGVVFENAVSQVPLTLPSHASLFTGLLPARHAVHDNGGFVLGPGVPTLAERLRAGGYATAAFVASYVLHSRWGLARGHDTYDDSFDYAGIDRGSLSDVERAAGPVVDRAIDWLRAPQRRAHPFYLWVHLYDPHEPYAPPAEYRRRAPSAYAGEVMYADAQAGRLLGALDSLGLRRRTLVVCLSDHGESLGEHGESTHGIFLYGATLDVPLILALPPDAPPGSPLGGLAGRRVPELARLVDVTPTLLDLVGQPVPEGLDGESLVPTMVARAAPGGGPAASVSAADDAEALAGPVSFAETWYPRYHYGWSELFAVETRRWKYVRAPRPELYDRESDPEETRDVSRQHPRVAATLAAQLAVASLVKAGAEPTPAKIDPEARERLRALGYVAPGEGGVRRAGPRPDPKDAMPLLQELLQAQAQRDEGRLEEAARSLEALVRKDPENPAVHLALSSVYFRRMDAANAVAAARRAVELDPESAVAVLDLALSYRAQGRLAEAAAGFERVLQLDAGNLKALVGLGDLKERAGEREKALDLYQRAVAVAPGFALAQVGLGNVALSLQRLDAAESALRKAVALGADAPGLHYDLGVIAEQRGQGAVAAREYRAEVAAHPESYKAWVNLGLLERGAGRTDAALAAFERAARGGPAEMAGPYLMAETLLALGRRDEAGRWAQEALRRSPNDARARQLAARSRARR